MVLQDDQETHLFHFSLVENLLSNKMKFFQRKELVTAFNGRKCVFRAASAEFSDRGPEDPHVYLLCVSVARQASAQETVRMVSRLSFFNKSRHLSALSRVRRLELFAHYRDLRTSIKNM